MTDERQLKVGPFVPANSDGCTLLSWPYNKLTGKKLPFRHCCITHDEAYWYGGPAELRLEADRKLRDCVYSYRNPHSKISTFTWWVWSRIMYAAVRFGGSPRLPTPFRWKYSNPYVYRNIIKPYDD